MKKILVGSPEYFALTEGERNHEEAPTYLMMNLETSCPLRCPKCAQDELPYVPQAPLSIGERIAVIEAATQLGVRCLVIVGEGEPTVPYNFRVLVRPVIEAAHARGLVTIMFTTGLGLHLEGQIEFYKAHSVSLYVSLDALEAETYRSLTGGRGSLGNVLRNVAALRVAYDGTRQTLADERALVRLGVNITVQRGNMDVLGQFRAFAGDDMQFVANEPMPRGRYTDSMRWAEFVGSEEEHERAKQLAREYSETGGHTSVVDDVCSYFFRGVSVASDGALMSCGYGAETAAALPNVREALGSESVEQLAALLAATYRRVRAAYRTWRDSLTGDAASDDTGCPLRNRAYQEFVGTLRESAANLQDDDKA